jgi:hypothetical protein
MSAFRVRDQSKYSSQNIDYLNKMDCVVQFWFNKPPDSYVCHKSDKEKLWLIVDQSFEFGCIGKDVKSYASLGINHSSLFCGTKFEVLLDSLKA